MCAVGARANAPTGVSDIPWLWLNVVSSSKTGILGSVTNVMRMNTVGGQAPNSGSCTVGEAGTNVKIPYKADYVFWIPLIFVPAFPTNLYTLPAITPGNLNGSSAKFTPILKIHGIGTQNYVCNGTTWNFVAPEANLSVTGQYLNGK